MEPESCLFSRTHHPPDLFEYYLVVCPGKEAPWWKASAIWFVAFPVLLIHTRQCHPEYSGVRENAVQNLGCQMGQRQWLPASVVTPVLTRDSSCSLLCLKHVGDHIPSQVALGHLAEGYDHRDIDA